PAPCADQPSGHAAEESAIARQAAVPNREDVPGIVDVALRPLQVRDHVHDSGSDDGRDDDPDEGTREPGIGIPVVAESFREVAVPEPEGERESNAVGMDLQRSEMEDDGYW